MSQTEFGKKSWAYALGCIKATSHPPLTTEQKKKLCDSTAEEMKKLLDEFAWGRGSEGLDFEQRVEKELKYVSELILDVCSDSRLTSLLLWEKDAYNLKLFLKGRLIDRDVFSFADRSASIPPEIIKASVETGDYSMLGEEAAAELDKIGDETNVFSISNRADRAIFLMVSANAKKLCRPLYNMLQEEAASKNRMSIIRADALGISDISNLLLPTDREYLSDKSQTIDEIRAASEEQLDRAMYDLRISEGFGPVAEYYFAKKRECEFLRLLWCEKTLKNK